MLQAVKLANIVTLAKEASVDVTFELPLWADQQRLYNIFSVFDILCVNYLFYYFITLSLQFAMGALEEDIGQDQAQWKFDIRSILSAKPSPI